MAGMDGFGNATATGETLFLRVAEARSGPVAIFE